MSQAKIYVGNLSYNTSEDELRDLFSQYGNIEDIKLIIDFSTGRSKGFGFVTYASPKECEIAVEKANNFELGGRKLKVNVARDDNRRTTGAGGPGNAKRSFNRQYRDRDDRSDRG